MKSCLPQSFENHILRVWVIHIKASSITMFYYKFNLGTKKPAWLDEIDRGISFKKPSLPAKQREGPLMESAFGNEEFCAFCFLFGLRYRLFLVFSTGFFFFKAWKLIFTWKGNEPLINSILILRQDEMYSWHIKPKDNITQVQFPSLN